MREDQDYSQEKIAVFLRFFKVPGNRAHILLDRPLNLFFSTILHKLCTTRVISMAYFLNELNSYDLSRRTVEIGISKADPLV